MKYMTVASSRETVIHVSPEVKTNDFLCYWNIPIRPITEMTSCTTPHMTIRYTAQA